MDREQAIELLDRELSVYRARTYTELSLLVGSLNAYEIPGPGGHPHQVEIQVVWDAMPGADIRVLGAIDDGGWSAFRPVSRDFLVTPDRESATPPPEPE